jgi:spermidine/putrescine transport system permease protein
MTAVDETTVSGSARAVVRGGPGPGLRRTGRWALIAWAALGMLYLFAPIVVIVVYSFNDPAGDRNLAWNGFSFDAWANPFDPAAEGDVLRDALLVSLGVATVATLVALVLGTLVALAIVRHRFRGGAAVDLFLVLPLTTPEVVMGASLASLFINRGIERGGAKIPLPFVPDAPVTVVIAHVVFLVSYVALTVKARLRGVDWSLEDAAMDLGAPPFRTFVRITLPLLAPGIVAAALLSFALSLDDFIITLFNSGRDHQTFPVTVWGISLRKLPPQINVLSTWLLIATIALLLVGTWVSARRGKASPAG